MLPPPTPSDAVLLQHKREAFDGMRAYHTSEINHKQHAIDILKTAITPVLAFYGGLITYTISNHPKPWAVITISLAVIGFVGWFAHSLVQQTCQKIEQDHLAYTRHRGEYIETLARLNLSSTHWRPLTEEEDKNTGYFYTQKILGDFRLLIVGTAIAGAILACLIALP